MKPIGLGEARKRYARQASFTPIDIRNLALTLNARRVTITCRAKALASLRPVEIREAELDLQRTGRILLEVCCIIEKQPHLKGKIPLSTLFEYDDTTPACANSNQRETYLVRNLKYFLGKEDEAMHFERELQSKHALPNILDTVAANTALIDLVIKRAIDLHEAGSGLAVVAVGNYGRGLTTATSEVDLFILLADNTPRSQAERAKAIIQDTLDSVGVEVEFYPSGYIKDWVELARDNVIFATDLDVGRCVGGEQQLLEELKQRVYPSLMDQQKVAECVVYSILYRERKVSEFEHEPFNLKYSSGGTRHLLLIQIIARQVFGIQENSPDTFPMTLAEQGIITPEEARKIREAFNFYLFISNQQHWITEMSGISRFQEEYRQHSSDVARLIPKITKAALDELTKKLGGKWREELNKVLAGNQAYPQSADASIRFASILHLEDEGLLRAVYERPALVYSDLAGLALNPHTPRDILAALAARLNEEDSDVHLFVARNITTPAETLRTVRQNPAYKQVVRESAERTLKEKTGKATVTRSYRGTDYHYAFWDKVIKDDLYSDFQAEKLDEIMAKVASRTKKPLHVLSLCAGHGYFPILIAGGHPNVARVVAIEVNPLAVELIRENAAMNDLSDKIEARIETHLYQGVREGEKFDLIISAPPPIPITSEELQALPPEIRVHHWIKTAPGKSGRNLIDANILKATQYLNPGGGVVLVHADFLDSRKTLGLMAASGLEPEIVGERKTLLKHPPLLLERSQRSQIESGGYRYPVDEAGEEYFHLVVYAGWKPV